MKEHFNSKVHLIAFKKHNDAKDNAVVTIIDEMNNKMVNTTCKIFNTVKRNRPFVDMEKEVELQIKNGIDLGVGLHSRYSATRIVEHISRELKSELFCNIVKRNLKVCIINEKASTISSKSVLVIFLKVEANDFCPTLFMDLVELEAQNAITIYNALLKTLSSFGMTKEYLQTNLVGFCSDGASATMLGCKSGVGTRIRNDFPNIIIWHCLNHRLHLALDDSIKDIKQINHFKIFIDKMYAIFHQSSKSQQELSNISNDLGIAMLKIGRVLGPRWAACSLRAARAIWRSYPVLYEYFSKNKKYSGMASRLRNKCFLRDLALMIDILDEISLLSDALQSRAQNIAKADQLILRTISALKQLYENLGVYERQVDNIVITDAYKKIDFQDNALYGNLPRKKLIDSLIKNMTLRLMNPEETNLKIQDNLTLNSKKIYDLVNTFEPTTWKLDEIINPWRAGEENVRTLSKILNIKICVNDFRDYVDNILRDSKNELPETVKRAKNIINTIAISSAEAERGFSLMNTICSEKRANLSIRHISDLMSINLMGLPLNSWDATPYVQSWLRSHHSADDNRVRHTTTISPTDNQNAIWNLFLKK